MPYSYDESRNLRNSIQQIEDLGDVRQFLVDLKEYLDELGCDFANNKTTRDDNKALVDLLVYLKEQTKAQLDVVDFLKRFPPQMRSRSTSTTNQTPDTK